MNKKVSRVLKIAAAVLLAAILFIAGYVTSYFVNTSYSSSLKWALSLIEEKYYEDIDGDIAGVAIDAIVDTYLDQYSEYYTAEEYKELVDSNSGKKTGIGVSYCFVEGSGVLINYVMGNSPAWLSGLRAGDYLTGCLADGESVEFTCASDFSSAVENSETGEDITFYSSDGGEYVIAKSSYTASYAYLCTGTTAWTVQYTSSGAAVLVESEEDKIEYLPEGCGYIKLLQFYGNAGKEFGYLLQKFYELGCDTLYLDLRSNGGGYVTVMQQISGYFVSSGSEVMRAKFKSGSDKVYDAASTGVDAEVSGDTAVYVLANSGTASASEALIGVLISYGVIGYEDVYVSYYGDEYISWLGTSAKNGRTYGKGIMQETIVNASTGEALKLTTAKIYWPNDNCIHDVGITQSDGCTLVDASWVVTKDDAELYNVIQISRQ